MFDLDERMVATISILCIGSVNLITFIAFGLDKRFSRRGGWRVPEMTLLLFAAAGGTVGALLGQRYFRHKTKKQPFKGRLYLIAVLHTVLLGLFLASVFEIL
jgi:uncharacterized membrane protein YsdA (DUF1294 family)